MSETTLETIELGPEPGEARASVIWLHGLGASGDDFVPVVPQLRRPDLRFIFPHAPIQPVTINMGMRMRSWYDIRSLDDSPDRESPEDVARSAALVVYYGAPLPLYSDLSALLAARGGCGRAGTHTHGGGGCRPARVCVGKEWYRFQSSFFLPEKSAAPFHFARLRFSLPLICPCVPPPFVVFVRCGAARAEEGSVSRARSLNK